MHARFDLSRWAEVLVKQRHDLLVNKNMDIIILIIAVTEKALLFFGLLDIR